MEPQQQFVAQPTQFVAQPQVVTVQGPTPVVATATPVLPSPTPVAVVVEERQQPAETNRDGRAVQCSISTLGFSLHLSLKGLQGYASGLDRAFVDIQF